jgi:hypothetical protein
MEKTDICFKNQTMGPAHSPKMKANAFAEGWVNPSHRSL